MFSLKSVAAAAFVVGATLRPAQSAGLIAFEEAGPNVVATLSGELFLPFYEGPIDPLDGEAPFPFIASELAWFSTGNVDFPTAHPILGPDNFGDGGLVLDDIVNNGATPLFLDGDAGLLYINEVEEAVPENGLDGGFGGTFVFLSWSLTFEGQTIASLGLTPGETVYTIAEPLIFGDDASVFTAAIGEETGNTLTIRVGPEVIPLPAAGLLLIGGLGALAMVRRRRG